MGQESIYLVRVIGLKKQFFGHHPLSTGANKRPALSLGGYECVKNLRTLGFPKLALRIMLLGEM